MFLLKKAFDMRDKANPTSADKPFLEHLEELRIVITRIAITLIIATFACYAFKDNLMELLRKPIEVVWEKSQKARLPADITPNIWEQAKLSSDLTSSLSPEAKTVYFQQFEDSNLSFYSECAGYYRAARSIQGVEKQNLFIHSLPHVSEKVKEQTKSLLETQPDEKIGARDNAVFMSSLRPTETFMLSLKLAFFAGVIVSFPFILFFSLQFVLPGLKPEERKALWPAMAAGFGLFLSGVLFCYFWVLPEALEFFYGYSTSMGVSNEWRIGDYITFATQFTLIFGLAFELPVVVMTLVKLGILNYDIMSRTRSYAIVSILVIGAVITPTGDILTLSMLAGPMCILYEICIWLAYFSKKKQIEEEEAEQADLANYRKLKSASVTTAAGATVIELDSELAAEISDTEVCSDDEGEELDDGILEEENDEADEETNETPDPSVLDTLRAPYVPYAEDSSYDFDDDEEEDEDEKEDDEPKKDDSPTT